MEIDDYIYFIGVSNIPIYGYIIKFEDDDTFTYVRDSLTVWNASKKILESGHKINPENFMEQVKSNAIYNNYHPPTIDQIKQVLEIYKKDPNTKVENVKHILNY
jgi:hypothetical protein